MYVFNLVKTIFFLNFRYLLPVDYDWDMVEFNSSLLMVNTTMPFPNPNYAMLRDNLLKINVKLNRINTTLTQDTVAMTPSMVIGSLGGILNLWIGKSQCLKYRL